MNHFYWMKCSAKPSTSITKCNKRLYSIKNIEEEKKSDFNNHNLCKTHYNILEKNSSVQLWNGSILSIDKKTKIIQVSSPITLYKQLYLTFLNTELCLKHKMHTCLRIISNGTMTNVIEKLCEIGAFSSKKEVFDFFRNVPKKILVHKLRFFYGIYYYYHIHTKKIIFLQRTIRQKIYFLKHKKSIIRIQRYIKHKQWLSSLPIAPDRLRKVFMKNIDKIKKIQKLARKYISNFISHDCPYTLESFINIPEKYRIFYSVKTDTNTHYFFFNIKWLHQDWISQIEKKTFVINPLTKEEFPNTFIEKVSRKVWKLTRKDNDYCINESCNLTHEYDILQDWNIEFLNRSFYSKCMMILDISNLLEIPIPNIISFYNSLEKIDYIHFFTKLFTKEFFEFISDLSFMSLYDTIHNNILDIKKSLFKSNEMENILYGSYLYYIISILYYLYRHVKEEDIYHFIKTMFQTNFKKCLLKNIS